MLKIAAVDVKTLKQPLDNLSGMQASDGYKSSREFN